MIYQKSLIGSAVAFIVASSCCWLPALLIAIGGGSTIVGLSSGLERFSSVFMAVGVGLLTYGLYPYLYKRSKPAMTEAILHSTITCPECGHQQEETMPTNACQYFYECKSCHSVLKPEAGDCCVYCSYGTVACPPIQLDQACC